MRRKRRSEIWTALYDEKPHSMLVSRKGKVITIYPDSGLIMLGSREYHKIEIE